jgi:hypothetical protein
MMSRIRLLIISLGLTIAVTLEGCVTTLVGGIQDNSIEVVIDEQSFSQSARNALLKAKNLGVVSLDRASIKAADLFETRGGYIVTIDRQTAKSGEMTGSERREALTNLCKSKNLDLAMLGHIVKTESGGMVGAMITGRAKVDQNWIMDMLACKTSIFYSFGGILKMNIGVYNANTQAQTEEMIGTEIGGKILASISKNNKGVPDSRDDSAQGLPSKAPEGADKLSSTILPPSGVQPKDAPTKSAKAMSNAEAQRALGALGYDVGKADGVIGKRTIEIFKKFQRDNNIPVTGLLDSETATKLGNTVLVR